MTVSCAGAQPPPPPVCNIPVVIGCSLARSAAGKEILTVTGSNISAGATITVGGVSLAPQHVVLNVAAQTFTLKGGGLCKDLPGEIVITNPATTGCTNASQAVLCNETCPK